MCPQFRSIEQIRSELFGRQTFFETWTCLHILPITVRQKCGSDIGIELTQTDEKQKIE